MKWIRIDISDELHRALRLLAADRGTTIKALVTEALENLVKDEKEQT